MIRGEPEKFILMIAHLVPWKRHDLAIQALAELRKTYPDLKLIIIGDDIFHEHGDYVHRLNEIVNQNNLAENVLFAGIKNHVSQYLNRCIMLVHPADQEPLGRAVIEAMKMGNLVVAADSGGIPEYVKHNVNGFLFHSGNLQDLITKINAALNHPNPDNVRRNAVATASCYFNVHKQAEKVLGVYDEIFQIMQKADSGAIYT